MRYNKKLFLPIVVLAVVVVSALSLHSFGVNLSPSSSPTLSCPANNLTTFKLHKLGENSFPYALYKTLPTRYFVTINTDELSIPCEIEFVLHKCQFLTISNECINGFKSKTFTGKSPEVCLTEIEVGFELKEGQNLKC